MNRFSVSVATVFVACSVLSATDSFWDKKREEMVRDQIESRGVLDQKVLRAMRRVPRHLFVPQPLRQYAYGDFPLPIGEEQTISQPYMVAIMTEALSLSGDERVLEVGTGSGYQAAVLAEIAENVYTVEILPLLAARADSLLHELGYDNVLVKTGDGYVGFPEYAPFDAIMVTCAPPYVPQPLIDQLADGGRLVLPVGEEGEVQMLTLIEKTADEVIETPLFPCVFVPMRSERLSGTD
jgi:protein-L-isoaspartate(D-aspartate) O-methyltransferase